MEGKDTIQLLKQHEEGRGHSTGHHLNTQDQPKKMKKKKKKRKEIIGEQPGSQSLFKFKIVSSLKNRQTNGDGGGGGVENKHRGVRRAEKNRPSREGEIIRSVRAAVRD